MSQFWTLIRRHPFATFLVALFVLIGILDGSGAGIGTAVFFILVVLAVAFVFDRIKRRRGSRARDQEGRFVARTKVTPVRRGRGSPAAIDLAVSPMFDQRQAQINRQTAELAQREQQLQVQRDRELQRREQDLAAREADIRDRETGPFPTPQEGRPLTPQQMSAKTDAEQLSPAGQSAFAETAHQPLPVAPRRESSLITINHLLAMTPTGFEEFCVRALEGIGYTEVRRVGGAGDLTADIFGIDNVGRSTVVQCKRYKPGTKVGSPALQMFIGMKSVHHQAERGIYMTTADYSVPAVRLARQHDIVLIDGDDMVKIAGLVMMPQSTPQVAAGAARYCTNCGAEFTADERFCKSCGAARAA